ncbi:lamin tail domain-containing protein, partial [Verrucomicrobiales bacterium]|nr:lamin tail domain-containing protein [Verrucomicrobiales bacterium]
MRFFAILLGIAWFTSAAKGQPQITEFVAINAASLADGDGSTPDWIEIHNPQAEPLSLWGYHLTDDVEIPDKFTFPEGAMLSGGGYLVVFASGKDEPGYTDASGNLHTNFSLDGDGDYLALSAPDGTLIQVFDPSYSKQFEDVSYGIGTSAAFTSLVTSETAATWFVPNADIGSDWQMADFDAAAWNNSSVGVGYGHDALVSDGGNTRSVMWFGNPSVYLRVPFGVEDPSAITSLTLNMRFDDGFVAYVNGTRVAAANAPDEAELMNNSTATAERPEDRVAAAEAFTIPANVLVSGTNVLAIHGLNFSASGANSADFLALPELTGLSTDAAGNFGYFTKPTPGKMNGESPLIGFVEDTKFSHDRGYHTEAFDLAITTATPGATIIYTTDGTPPSPDTGNIFVDTMNGTIYTEPIAISETTTLRAMAMKTGYQSTNIDTQTYLYVDDIVRQDRPSDYPSSWGGGRADYDMDPDIVDHPDYADKFHKAFAALPSLSLVFDPDAFFAASTGIYQNPQREGANWERPLSVEFMMPDDSEPGFQINAGVRVQGGSSRNT